MPSSLGQLELRPDLHLARELERAVARGSFDGVDGLLDLDQRRRLSASFSFTQISGSPMTLSSVLSTAAM